MKSEWSLIFFTLLTQIAIGSFIVFAGLNLFSVSKAESILPRELGLKILYIIFALAIVAMVSSFLHLGKPKNAIYALTNIGSSWLSREILFVILFVGMAFIYTFFEYTMIGSTSLKTIIAILGILIGFLAVFSMAKLYMLDIVPAWNSINTFVQFYSTTIVLGIISVCLLIYSLNSDILLKLNSLGIYRVFFILILMFIVFGLLSFLYKLWSLSAGGQTELASFAQIVKQNPVLFYLRIVLSVIAILIIIYQLVLTENTYSSQSLILLAILTILSELAGRYLFYASYNRVGI